MSWYDGVTVDVLKGKTLTEVIQNGKDEIVFRTTEGEEYAMYHQQDCCESVYIEDISGNLEDLVGSPLLMAEESSNRDDPPPQGEGKPESYTWTFYRFATIKGSVTMRWYGESSGYYSESVDFQKR